MSMYVFIAHLTYRHRYIKQCTESSDITINDIIDQYYIIKMLSIIRFINSIIDINVK